jgi:hypothetical protein
VYPSKILDKKQKSRKLFYGFVLGLIGAYFTKSTAALIPIPSLLVSTYLLNKNQLLHALKKLAFAIAILSLLVVPYYIFMESVTPGYWDKVWLSEFKRTYINLMPWHDTAPSYYFEFLGEGFYPFVVLLPLGFLLKNRVFTAGFCFVLLYAFVLSYPPSKLFWYILPVFPILALIFAITLDGILEQLGTVLTALPRFAFYTLVVLLFAQPLFKIIQTNSKKKVQTELENEGDFMRELRKFHPNYRSYTVSMYSRHPEHFNQVFFYKNMFNDQFGYHIKFNPKVTALSLSDTILICQEKKLDTLRNMGKMRIIETGKGDERCKLVVFDE